MLKRSILTVGPFQSNVVLVWCPRTRDAVLFDAGDDAASILALIEEVGAKVKAVVLTHAHIDHVSALAAVVSALDGVPVFMHKAEIPIYDMLAAQAAMFGLDAPQKVSIQGYIADGETLHIGDNDVGAIHAPGHSPGSLCFRFQGERGPELVAGDTLFMGSIGRTDLPGSNHNDMMRTLREVFLPMPDELVVHPGHGPSTTIGQEKQTNPFVAPLVD